MEARRKKSKTTPIRRALLVNSALQTGVNDGIGAVKNTDRVLFAPDVRSSFSDSLDLDSALQRVYPGQNRWDYLLGHKPSDKVVAVEPHSAKQDEITTVINKRKAAKQQLAAHLKPGVRVAKWLWVASGKVYFADTEKVRLRLDQNGIEFAGKQVLAKHLPSVRYKGRCYVINIISCREQGYVFHS
jgi:hypothetical protein